MLLTDPYNKLEPLHALPAIAHLLAVFTQQSDDLFFFRADVQVPSRFLQDFIALSVFSILT